MLAEPAFEHLSYLDIDTPSGLSNKAKTANEDDGEEEASVDHVVNSTQLHPGIILEVDIGEISNIERVR